MPLEPTPEEWNRKFVNLTYAALGLITPNVRRIELDWHEGQWVVKLTLGTPNPDEAEELGDDLFTGFEAPDGDGNFRGVIEVNSGDLTPPPSGRVVYWRREDGEFGNFRG
jgi:hypothetical protein